MEKHSSAILSITAAVMVQEYLLFLYKDPLPQGGLLEGWNELDETSYHITIVGVHDHRIAVEDFLVCHNPELTWERCGLCAGA